MAQRDELLKKFGPLLFEAFTELLLAEINTLRTQAGLPPRTKDQVMRAMENALTNLQPYDWMKLT